MLILSLGWRYPLLGFFIPLCMLAGVGLGLFRGRKWCDWYCPRGSFYDTAVSLLSPKRDIPALLRAIPFRLLIMSALMIIMGINLVLRWPDISKIGLFFVIMLTVTTAFGVILAVIFHQRSWCMICPIGTVINLIARGRYPLKIDSELCNECKICPKVCPLQLKPYLYKSRGIQLMKDADCLKCGLCVKVCPQKALNF